MAFQAPVPSQRQPHSFTSSSRPTLDNSNTLPPSSSGSQSQLVPNGRTAQPPTRSVSRTQRPGNFSPAIARGADSLIALIEEEKASAVQSISDELAALRAEHLNVQSKYDDLEHRYKSLLAIQGDILADDHGSAHKAATKNDALPLALDVTPPAAAAPPSATADDLPQDTNIEQRYQELEKEHLALKAQHTAMEEQLDKLKTQSSILSFARASVQEKLTATETRCSGLSKVNAELSQSLSSAQSECSDLRSELSVLKTYQNQAFHMKMKELTFKHDRLLEAHSALKGFHSDLQSQKASLETRFSELEAKLDDSGCQLVSCRSRVAELENLELRLTEQLAALNARVSSAESAYSQLQTEHSLLQSEKAELETERQCSNVVQQQLRDELVCVREEKAKEVEAERASASSLATALVDRIADLAARVPNPAEYIQLSALDAELARIGLVRTAPHVYHYSGEWESLARRLDATLSALSTNLSVSAMASPVVRSGASSRGLPASPSKRGSPVIAPRGGFIAQRPTSTPRGGSPNTSPGRPATSATEGEGPPSQTSTTDIALQADSRTYDPPAVLDLIRCLLSGVQSLRQRYIGTSELRSRCDALTSEIDDMKSREALLISTRDRLQAVLTRHGIRW